MNGRYRITRSHPGLAVEAGDILTVTGRDVELRRVLSDRMDLGDWLRQVSPFAEPITSAFQPRLSELADDLFDGNGDGAHD